MWESQRDALTQFPVVYPQSNIIVLLQLSQSWQEMGIVILYERKPCWVVSIQIIHKKPPESVYLFLITHFSVITKANSIYFERRFPLRCNIRTTLGPSTTYYLENSEDCDIQFSRSMSDERRKRLISFWVLLNFIHGEWLWKRSFSLLLLLCSVHVYSKLRTAI